MEKIIGIQGRKTASKVVGLLLKLSAQHAALGVPLAGQSATHAPPSRPQIGSHPGHTQVKAVGT